MDRLFRQSRHQAGGRRIPVVDVEIDDESEDEPSPLAKSNDPSSDKECLKPEEITAYVQSLRSLSETWYKIHFPLDVDEFDNEIKILLERLNRLRMRYFKPLVLIACSKIEGNESNLRELLRALERFLFVSFMMGKRRADYQQNFYRNLAGKLFRDKITFKEITAALNAAVDSQKNVDIAINNFSDELERCFNSKNIDGIQGYYASSLRPFLNYVLGEYEYSLRAAAGETEPRSNDIKNFGGEKKSGGRLFTGAARPFNCLGKIIDGAQKYFWDQTPMSARVHSKALVDQVQRGSTRQADRRPIIFQSSQSRRNTKETPPSRARASFSFSIGAIEIKFYASRRKCLGVEF